jgi:hypothetical protein
VLLGFAFGHLGLHVAANGTMLIYGQPVLLPTSAALTTAREPVRSTGTYLLPTVAAVRWPADLKGVLIGGVNVGGHGRVTVGCNISGVDGHSRTGPTARTDDTANVVWGAHVNPTKAALQCDIAYVPVAVAAAPPNG